MSPSFATRLEADEMMDDFSIVDERLTVALDNLRHVNRFLGGYAATRRALEPLLERRRGGTLRILDLATGLGDTPAFLVRWAEAKGVTAEIVGIDANPVTVDYARGWLDGMLPAGLRERVDIRTGDALDLPFEDDAFDVCIASLFMHHLAHDEAVTLLRAMRRVARDGLIINDLHRHPLAYYSIFVLGHLLPTSPMFRHDGPISVLRAFTRTELRALAEDAGLAACTIRWHWAFRWTLSTIATPET